MKEYIKQGIGFTVGTLIAATLWGFVTKSLNEACEKMKTEGNEPEIKTEE